MFPCLLNLTRTDDGLKENVILMVCVYSFRLWSPTDYAYRNGSLWQGEGAYVTGDMRMLLPPVSNIKLDAYTGYVSQRYKRNKSWRHVGGFIFIQYCDHLNMCSVCVEIKSSR